MPTRRAAAALFALGLLVFWIQSIAWPFQRGRDAWDFFLYYLSLPDAETPFPLVMLVRTPLTPVALSVPMHLGGALALEIVLSVLYAASIVAWAAVAARVAGAAAAVAMAFVMLAYVGYASMFHEVSSDPVTAAAFALFALAAVATVQRPSVARFALLGLGAAALVFVRPANGVLYAVALLAVLAAAPWRVRVARGAAFAAAAAVPVVLWASLNHVRYGDFTISRLGAATFPFWATFGNGEISPDNGPASARLARIVEREVLSTPAYRRLDVDAHEYFRKGSNFEAVRLWGISDRVDGLGSDYRLLHDAAAEADRSGGEVLGIDADDTWRALWGFLSQPVLREFREKPREWPDPPLTVERGGVVLPNPAALPPPPQSATYGFVGCASDEIDRCILRDAAVAYEDEALVTRYREVTDVVRKWDAELGTRRPNAWLAAQLTRVSWRFPDPWLWLVAGAAALAVRRPRRAAIVVALLALGVLVLLVHAAVIGAIPGYGIPFLPTTFLFGIWALTAERRAGTVRDPARRPLLHRG